MARISKGQLEKLQKKYKTDAAIGKLFGISRQAVHQLRSGYRIDPIPNKHRDRDAEIIKSYHQGIPGTRIAKKFRLSVSQTYRIIGLRSDKRGKKK
jgi:hypothetical protein